MMVTMMTMVTVTMAIFLQATVVFPSLFSSITLNSIQGHLSTEKNASLTTAETLSQMIYISRYI